MPLPLDQWQFYVVTAVALAGAYVLLRPFLPGGRTGGSGCSGCSSGSTSTRRRRRAVPLTIGGRRR